MNGRAFLPVAATLATGPTEAYWRTAAGRAYYAIFLEGRSTLARWGFSPSARENAHRFVRLHFASAADPDLKSIGKTLDTLSRLRNQADYQLGNVTGFQTNSNALQAVTGATAAIALLDQIDADPARRTAAVQAITASFGP